MPAEPISETDFILKLARKNGYTKLETLWAESGLDAKRSNPNILFHGIPAQPHATAHGKFAQADECNVPPVHERSENKSTDAHHSFKTGQDKLYLRLRVVDSDFKAFEGATYSMTVDGADIDASKLVPDSDGVLNVEVSPTADSGKLTLTYTPKSSATANTSTPSGLPSTSPTSSPTPSGPKPVTVVFYLRIGRLDPIKDISPAPDQYFTPGVQQRLNNLGFGAGGVSGVVNDTTHAALRRFQKLCGVTGEESAGKAIAGPQTLDWLEKLHDKPGMPPPPETTTSTTTTTPSVTPLPSTSTPTSTQTQQATQPPIPDPVPAARQRYEIAKVKLAEAQRKRSAAYRNLYADPRGYTSAKSEEFSAKQELDRAKLELEKLGQRAT